MDITNKNILKDYIREIILDEGYVKNKKLPPMRNELYWLIRTIDADEKDILYEIEHGPRVTATLIRELDELGYETEFLEYLNTILPKNHKRYSNVDEFADYVIAGDFWTTDFHYDFIDTFNDFLVNTLNDKGVKNKNRIYPGEKEKSDIKDMIGYAQSAGGINGGNTKQSFSNNYKALRNEWLIHFTDRRKMYGILNNGFRYGVSDPQGLALTKRIDHEKKEDKAGSGVYVFAFPANNSPDPRYPIYGDKKTAVLFRATAAVQSYHFGDLEHQVIAFSKDIYSIVGLTLEERYNEKEDKYVEGWTPYGFTTDRKNLPNLPLFKDFDECVAWAIANYEKYRRVISSSKT